MRDIVYKNVKKHSLFDNLLSITVDALLYSCNKNINRKYNYPFVLSYHVTYTNVQKILKRLSFFDCISLYKIYIR